MLVLSMSVRELVPGFDPPPALLVEDGRQHLGRFGGPPARANLIDAAYLRLPRTLRRLRLKEWQAVQITTPRWFVNVALFDAKLLQLLQVKIYDRERGAKHLHERQLRPGKFHLADELVASTNSFRDERSALTFVNRFASGRIDVAIDVPRDEARPAIRGRIAVHTDRGASQVVSLPFAGDTGMYSHKGLFPAEGELSIGDESFRLAGTDTLALLDDHKGYYPYIMKWDWVTAASRDARGRAIGFNLTHNQCRDPERFNENCAWIDDRVGSLPTVTFERERAREPGERWRIRDREGRVELDFEPKVAGDLALNALVIESRYRGPFGTFSGRLAPEGLDPVELDGWFGMGEQFWLRC